MATRSRIAIQNEDGTVTSIYCHWDGYLENNGKILFEHYNDLHKIRSLLDLGDLSSLGPDLGTKHDFDDYKSNDCTAYGRDRGEDDTFAKKHDSVEDYLKWGEEFNYLYTNGEWFVNVRHQHEIDFKSLAFLLGEETNKG